MEKLNKQLAGREFSVVDPAVATTKRNSSNSLPNNPSVTWFSLLRHSCDKENCSGIFQSVAISPEAELDFLILSCSRKALVGSECGQNIHPSTFFVFFGRRLNSIEAKSKNWISVAKRKSVGVGEIVKDKKTWIERLSSLMAQIFTRVDDASMFHRFPFGSDR